MRCHTLVEYLLNRHSYLYFWLSNMVQYSCIWACYRNYKKMVLPKEYHHHVVNFKLFMSSMSVYYNFISCITFFQPSFYLLMDFKISSIALVSSLTCSPVRMSTRSMIMFGIHPYKTLKEDNLVNLFIKLL